MSTMGDENFDEWYARNHPFDWFTKELGQPVPMTVRLKVWGLCRSAWFHTERSPARGESAKAGG